MCREPRALCIVFDRSGRIAASAQKEHEQIYPQPGGRAVRSDAVEGSIAIRGVLVQWVGDNLGLIEKSSESRRLHGQ